MEKLTGQNLNKCIPKINAVFLINISNGAKLGDATVARAPPLLRPPRKFVV